MPIVCVVEGYVVRCYTRDEHRPPHVHVEKAGTNIKVMIADDVAEYRSYKGRRPKQSEIVRATEIVAENFELCLTTWRRCHERNIDAR